MAHNFDLKDFLELIKNIEDKNKEKKDKAYKTKIEAIIDELKSELNELNALKIAIIGTLDSKVKNTELKIAIYTEELKKCSEN